LRALADAALDPSVFATAFATGQQMKLAEAFVTLQSPRN